MGTSKPEVQPELVIKELQEFPNFVKKDIKQLDMAL